MTTISTKTAIEEIKSRALQNLFIISPYHDDKEEIMDERYEAAVQVCGELTIDGFLVFSPIVHCHLIAKRFKLPRDRGYWAVYDESFAHWAQAGYVLCFSHWWESSGSQEDIRCLWRHGKPVFYSNLMNHVP